MTSINKLIEIKYLNDSTEFFDCYENLDDFIEDVKDRFSLNEKDLKENVIFFIVDEKKKQKIDIFKDYKKFILNNDKMIIYLEIENKNKNISNEKKEISNENKKNSINNNNINNKLSISKDQIKNILEKNNENLINNFSNNLNNLNSKINSIEKTMIEINKNIQNVPNLINQTFSIQFPQIEDKINKKLINLQKMIINLIKNNKDEINNMLEKFNSDLLNNSVAIFNEKNNNNYDILLENHNKLKEELSNKNKIEADLKKKIKEFEKKIENINLSNKNKENDYVKKMKDNLNEIKKFRENEKSMKKEIYLLKEKINDLNNLSENFNIDDNNNKTNIKNNKSNTNNKNNMIKSCNVNNNNNNKKTINKNNININSDSEDDKINDVSSDGKERINEESSEENENNNNNNKINNNNKNNNKNKISNDILNESIKYEYEFVPKESTYFIEKSKLKEMNNKSVNYKISIKNKGKISIPENSYVCNENLVNNNYFKFFGKVLKEIKPNETGIINGKILVKFDKEIKKNYILVLKLYNKNKKEFSDCKFILNINIVNDKKNNFITELTNEQINKIISEIYENFGGNELILKKFNFKNEISELMKDEDYQNFDDFDDLKEKIIEDLIDKICS